MTDKERIEQLEMHERNLEESLKEIIELVKTHDEELAYDCEQIVDEWSQT